MSRLIVALLLLSALPAQADTLSLSQTAAHACAVHAGSVRCWGTQPNGGLGNPEDEANKQLVVAGISNAIAVGVGNSHSCALITGGTVQCWGRGSEGQLGNASNMVTQRTPVAVTGLSGAATAIALADLTTCAIISGGSVQCFGLDSSGELGNDAALTNSNVPVTVSGISTAQQLTAGARHFCARLSDGSARCWGSNTSGQLGDNSISSRTTPVAVSGLSGVTQISGGQFHTCATIAAGLRCWGNNAFGQLGTGNFNASMVPVVATAVSGTITRLRAGGRHTCAQTGASAITCFGRNFDGQLTQATNSPFLAGGAPMQGLPTAAVIELAAGTSNTCVRITDEDIRCAGSGSFGQLGDARIRRWKTPVAAIFNPTAELSLGAQRTCSKLSNEQPSCVGYNGSGGLGDGTTDRRLSPVTVSGSVTTGTLFSSESQTCASLIGASATQTRCWGRNDVGQLGLSTIGDQFTATPAPAFSDSIAMVSIAQGTFFGCALRSDTVSSFGVRCWGNNQLGQLGDGSTVSKFANQSINVIGLTNPVQIVAGRAHACAREQAGTVKCWGTDASGELGDGAAVGPVGTPVTVSGLTGVTSLAIGRDGSHTCALLSDNTARCWGSNSFGQVGNSTLVNQNAPAVVSGAFTYSQLFTGISHTCGLLISGEVRCWGSNQLDQLGVAAVTFSNAPIAVTGLNANVTKLAGGPQFNCALQSGAWKCWGYNSSGELGNGQAAVALLPVQVQTPNTLFVDGFE